MGYYLDKGCMCDSCGQKTSGMWIKEQYVDEPMDDHDYCPDCGDSYCASRMPETPVEKSDKVQG